MAIDEDRIDQTPRGKAKSVALTEEGLRESARLFDELFTRPGAK